jgi:hypothetical protein
MEDNIEIESLDVESKFEENGNPEPGSLKDVLTTYLQSKTMPTQRIRHRYEDLLFKQEKNGFEYRGYIRVGVGFINNKSCLSITHVVIAPRGGDLLNPTLTEILRDSPLQSIMIENVMSEYVIEKFIEKGWKRNDDSDSVYLVKGGGKKKRTKKYRRKQIRKRRSYKQSGI